MEHHQRPQISRRRFLKRCMSSFIGIGALSCIPFSSRLLFAGYTNADSDCESTDLGIVFGATPIGKGLARHQQDFTIYNSKIAISFAAGSDSRWNMTKGSILDVAVMTDGNFGNGLIDDIEFLHTLWMTIGSYNGEDVVASPAGNVVWERNADKIVVTATTPYWTWTCGQTLPYRVVIEYTLDAGEDYLSVRTTVENPANNEPYENIITGCAENKYVLAGRQSPQKIKRKHGERMVFNAKEGDVSIRLDGINSCSGCKDSEFLRSIRPGQASFFKGEIHIANKNRPQRIA